MLVFLMILIPLFTPHAYFFAVEYDDVKESVEQKYCVRAYTVTMTRGQTNCSLRAMIEDKSQARNESPEGEVRRTSAR